MYRVFKNMMGYTVQDLVIPTYNNNQLYKKTLKELNKFDYSTEKIHLLL